MSKSQPNIQDLFLNQIRKENTAVTIYLTNGVQLRGHIRGFDPFTVLLESPGRPTQIVYKHAMTSIVPLRPVTGFTGGTPAEATRRVGEQGSADAAQGDAPGDTGVERGAET